MDVERDGDAAEGSSDARAVMERETVEDGSGERNARPADDGVSGDASDMPAIPPSRE